MSVEVSEAAYSDGSSLGEEANKIEVKLAMRGKCDTDRNHENDDCELPVWLCNAESPRD